MIDKPKRYTLVDMEKHARRISRNAKLSIPQQEYRMVETIAAKNYDAMTHTLKVLTEALGHTVNCNGRSVYSQSRNCEDCPQARELLTKMEGRNGGE